MKQSSRFSKALFRVLQSLLIIIVLADGLWVIFADDFWYGSMSGFPGSELTITKLYGGLLAFLLGLGMLIRQCYLHWDDESGVEASHIWLSIGAIIYSCCTVLHTLTVAMAHAYGV